MFPYKYFVIMKHVSKTLFILDKEKYNSRILTKYKSLLILLILNNTYVHILVNISYLVKHMINFFGYTFVLTKSI